MRNYYKEKKMLVSYGPLRPAIPGYKPQFGAAFPPQFPLCLATNYGNASVRSIAGGNSHFSKSNF